LAGATRIAFDRITGGERSQLLPICSSSLCSIRRASTLLLLYLANRTFDFDSCIRILAGKLEGISAQRLGGNLRPDVTATAIATALRLPLLDCSTVSVYIILELNWQVRFFPAPSLRRPGRECSMLRIQSIAAEIFRGTRIGSGEWFRAGSVVCFEGAGCFCGLREVALRQSALAPPQGLQVKPRPRRKSGASSVIPVPTWTSHWKLGRARKV